MEGHAQESGRRLRFAGFEFQPDTGELWRHGEPVRLQPQPAALLAELVDRPGRVVRREELYEALWPERIVEYDQALNFAVARLRKALGDDASEPRFVETVPHVGYRFVSPVEAVTEPPPTADANASSPPGAAPRGPTVFGPVGVAALAFVALGVILVLVLRDRPGLPGADDGPSQRLVVLPFEWAGSDPDPALADGLFHDLVTELATLAPEELAVIAPESARRAGEGARDPDTLAALLGVDWVVSGAIARTTPEEIEIHAHLTDTRTARVSWSDRFVRSAGDAGTVRRELTSRVADALALSADLPGTTSSVEPLSLATAEALRTARYLMDRGDSAGMRIAGERLRGALLADSASAPLHAELAEWHARAEGWDSARFHGERAVALDEREPRGHRQLARALLEQWDLAGAGRHYQRAVDLAPGVALYRAILPAYLSAVGRHDAAVHHLERAVALDPLAPVVYRDMGETLVLAGEPAEALPFCRRQRVLAPEEGSWTHCLYRAFSAMGKTDSAAAWVPRVMEDGGASEEEVARIAGAGGAAAVLRAYREWNAERLERLHAEGRLEAYFVARAHAALGDADAAAPWLDAALRERSAWSLYARSEPRFEAIRDDPRFQRFLAKIAAAVAEAETSPGPAGAPGAQPPT